MDRVDRLTSIEKATPTPATLQATRRSACSTKGQTPSQYTGYEAYYTGKTANLPGWKVQIPKTYNEAIQSEYGQQWKDAMQEQFDKLVPCRELSEQDAVLLGKCVFDLKVDANVYVLSFQARWVVYGNFQCLETSSY